MTTSNINILEKKSKIFPESATNHPQREDFRRLRGRNSRSKYSQRRSTVMDLMGRPLRNRKRVAGSMPACLATELREYCSHSLLSRVLRRSVGVIVTNCSIEKPRRANGSAALADSPALERPSTTTQSPSRWSAFEAIRHGGASEHPNISWFPATQTIHLNLPAIARQTFNITNHLVCLVMEPCRNLRARMLECTEISD